jgi:hypothetical protein
MEKKYLSIKLTGHNTVYAFKNEEKTIETQPDYKGSGVSVWINKKEEEIKIHKPEMIEDL